MNVAATAPAAGRAAACSRAPPGRVAGRRRRAAGVGGRWVPGAQPYPTLAAARADAPFAAARAPGGAAGAGGAAAPGRRAVRRAAAARPGRRGGRGAAGAGFARRGCAFCSLSIPMPKHSGCMAAPRWRAGARRAPRPCCLRLVPVAQRGLVPAPDSCGEAEQAASSPPSVAGRRVGGGGCPWQASSARPPASRTCWGCAAARAAPGGRFRLGRLGPACSQGRVRRLQDGHRAGGSAGGRAANLPGPARARDGRARGAQATCWRCRTSAWRTARTCRASWRRWPRTRPPPRSAAAAPAAPAARRARRCWPRWRPARPRCRRCGRASGSS